MRPLTPKFVWPILAGLTFLASPVHAELQSVGKDFIIQSGASTPTEKLRVTQAGLVGIGLTNPSYALDISGTSRATGEVITTNANAFRAAYGNYGAFWRNDGSNYYLLFTDSGNQYGTWNALRPIYVSLTTGAITIGQPSPSTVPALTVGGTILATKFSGDGSGLTNVSSGDRITSGTLAQVLAQTGGPVLVSGTAMYINNGGNNDAQLKVGATPSGNRYAYADFIGDTTYTGYGLRIIRSNGGANTGSYIQHRGTGALNLQTVDSGPLILSTSSTEAVRIDTAGKVGIGTSSPSATLHVVEANSGVHAGSFQVPNSNTAGLNISAPSGRITLIPHASVSAYNPLVLAGDALVNFSQIGVSDTGGLVLGPWTGSAKGIRIDGPTGNVSIGVASPTHAFQSANGGRLNIVQIGQSSANTADAAMAYPYESIGVTSMSANLRLQSPNSILFHTNVSTTETNDNSKLRMTITASGNVGIGTITPTTRLHLFNNGYNAMTVEGGTTAGAYADLAMKRGNTWWWWSHRDTSDLGLILSKDNGSTFTMPFWVQAATGFVGISTTNPKSPLHVVTTSSSGVIIEASSAVSGSPRINLVDTKLGAVPSAPTWVIDSLSDTMRFYRQPTLSSAGTVIMALTSASTVGINTGTPGAPLHVVAPNTNVPLILQNSAALWRAGPDSSGNFIIYNNSNVGMYMTNGGTSWIANSDRRLKKDITPLDQSKGLEAITKLTPVTFHWRTVGAPSTTQTGFIAQDVEKVFPELVSHAPNTAIRTDEGKTVSLTDVKGVNYEGLIMPMVQAIKQLKAENDSLRATVEAQGRAIRELQAGHR